MAGGSIIAEVPETKSIVHRVMLPPGVSGTVTAVKPDGDYTICDEIVTIRTTDGGTKALTMTQEWPIRKPRPVRLVIHISYRRNRTAYLDTLSRSCMARSAHCRRIYTENDDAKISFAKWCDADITIYIIGERVDIYNVLG